MSLTSDRVSTSRGGPPSDSLSPIDAAVLHSQLGDALLEAGVAPTADARRGCGIRVVAVPARRDHPAGVLVFWDVEGGPTDSGEVFDCIAAALDEALVVILDTVGCDISSSGVVFVSNGGPSGDVSAAAVSALVAGATASRTPPGPAPEGE